MSSNIALTIEKSVLLDALANVCPVIENRNVIEILGSLMLDARDGKLTISGTDLDILISETVVADTSEEGALAVDAKALYNIICKMPDGAISIRGGLDKGKVQIKTKGCRFSLPCLSANDFPLIDKGGLTSELEIAAADFLNILNKTKFAVSSDETRYNLTGVNLRLKDNHLVAEAANGHKLARVKTSNAKCDNFPNIIIPPKSIAVITKALNKQTSDMIVLLSESKLYISCDNKVIISKLIDGKFPDMDRVFPAGDGSELSINRDAIVTALGRVSLAADGKTNQVVFDFKDELLTISAAAPNGQTAEEDVEISDTIGELRVGFNSKYLIEALSNIQSENVNFNVRDKKHAMLITSDTNEHEAYIVMPMGV